MNPKPLFGVFLAVICFSTANPLALVHAWPVPDTGQTTCYDNTDEIPCPDPGDDFCGQDAGYFINPPSYTKQDVSGNALPDGSAEWITVKDNVTDLIWEVKHGKDGVQNYANPNDADNYYAWYDPDPSTNGGYAGTPYEGMDTQDFIDALNAAAYGGYTDWRLPDVSELASLFVYAAAGIAIDTRYFENAKMNWYWSATTLAGDTSQAWRGAFNLGFVSNGDKNGGCYVRAVRGERIQSLFVDNQDGTVTDIASGLMWQKGTATEIITWEAALDHCETMTLAGYIDWRLPTIKEQRALVDRSRYSPAIDVNVFPDTQPSFYWSSTTIPGYPEGAWCMDFFDGNEYGGLKNETWHVRAVRVGEANKILSVTPATRAVSAAAGTATFSVTNTGTGTMAWTAAVISGGDWLSIESGTSGGSDGTITCVFGDNENSSSRTGTIQVTAPDAVGSPMNVTVTQAGASQSAKLSHVINGLRLLEGINVSGGDSRIDADQDGKVEMKDVLMNLSEILLVGAQKTYEVNSSSGIEYIDDISGAVIIFPNGGSGTLTITKIATDPYVDPNEGNLFLLEFTGNDDIQIAYPRNGETEPLVWIYGIPEHPIDFSIDSESQWMPLPSIDTSSDPAIFDLYNPGESIPEAAAASLKTSSAKSRPPHSYKVYYQNALKYNNWAWKRILVLWDITKKTIADIYDILPASVQARTQSDYMSGLKPKGAYSGWSSGYIGFRYIAGLVRMRNPHFWYGVYVWDPKEQPDEAVAAHESGHYISHLIMGDDQYEKLSAQKKDPHDLADVHVNRDMLEEYAFFGDYFKNGDKLYGRYDIVHASEHFKLQRALMDKVPVKDVSPATYNWPNLEGFGCFFLARLNTEKGLIASHCEVIEDPFSPDLPTIKKEPAPIFGLDFTTLYEYLAKGPLTVNQLYDYVESSFTSDQKLKLAVLAEKMGWSYNGSGKIVDTEGEEVAAAMVENVSDYSDWPNYKNSGSAQTGLDGKFTINRVYPGKSKFRVHYNYSGGGQYLNYKDFDIDIPKEDPTNVSRNFGTLVVDKIENTEFNFSTVKVYINLKYPIFYYNDLPYQGHELCGYANHNDVGWVNFPSEQGKRFQGGMNGNMFTGTCASNLLGPGTGQISITLSPDRTRIEAFNLTFSNGYSDMNNFIIVSANAAGGGANPIPRTYFMSDYMAEFKVTGNHREYITTLDYSIKCKDNPDRTYSLSYGASTQELLLIRFE